MILSVFSFYAVPSRKSSALLRERSVNCPGTKKVLKPYRSRKRNCFSDRSASFRKWGYRSLYCCCAFPYVKGTKHVSLNLFYLRLLCDIVTVILIKSKRKRQYSDTVWWVKYLFNRSQGYRLGLRTLWVIQFPDSTPLLNPCKLLLKPFKKIKHIGVEGGRGEPGYFVQKIKSSVYFVKYFVFQ